MIWLRSLLFNIAFWGTTIGFGLICLPLMLAPRRWLLLPMRVYALIVIGWLRLLCGVRLVVDGRENLPQGPGLVAAKHQSAFDTIVWFALLPDAAYVLKRELLFIPIWGWYCWKTRHIAVDRAAGANALRHLVKAGKAAVAEGRQVVIFPEGTRVAPGLRVGVQPGIVALAAATALPVVPVATDSGLVWGRRAFRKQPGTITIRVRPAIPPGLSRPVLVTRLEAAIELAEDSTGQVPLVDKPVESPA
ncbi:lysophospholipid acyltransferase family protein [Paracraurococcus ruber]|uniref:1-acyl-sn-glycerol-3-phosphate acyltransferase n=1 Tax=Paracraurococcus ruber TaxID=77675 RepID=A0ABS1CU37_9PROT|nr:lysophospholipid acyltransferase family protein [Paracraurococcus ruber]MBK1658005.1 1-acyl-sn-glycerol-3-phosphate acyltransferase [Paracraurococcus ruber]TDG33813.1 1-acyl-sn-glycerol-3-phosphate acyltransferase [Paracraurococcus ruber]